MRLAITWKINNNNGLQVWKTKQQAVTGGIFYCRDSAGFSVSVSNKLSCNLTGNRPQSPTFYSVTRSKTSARTEFCML